ncbi:MAG: isoprenylcysteine carboxylmethyltransferase family protein [Acidobacteriota bacterium]
MQRLIAVLARRRVFAGLLLTVIVVVLAQPSPLSLAAGGVVSIGGEAIRVWASGYLRKNQALAMQGPYAYTRNPLYVGNLLIGIGVVIGSARWWLVAAYLAYYCVFYAATIRHEATVLAGLFGDEFEDYRKRVPALFPRYTRAAPQRGQPADGFELCLVWRNREYRAITAALLVYSFLAVRMYWP